MTAKQQPFPSPAQLRSLRRRTNLGIGVGLAVSLLAAYLTTGVKDLNSFLVWGWLPMMLVGCGLFYWGIYCYVRSKGYHGLWTLVVFLGPAIAGLLDVFDLQLKLGLGESGDMAVQSLIQLSGVAILVFLPRKPMRTESANTAPETLNP